jgi:hypothetical protein
MATTVDEILVRIELDMASLKRDLNRVSASTEKATQRMSDSFRRVGQAIAAVGGAAIFGNFIKSSIQTGIQIQSLEVQLKALLGSAEEGAAAFDHMQRFAARVPFSLRDIQRGAGSLAAASGNADNLNALLQVTGNIAAQFGMSFDEAAMNLQRALSAGIGAADLFRDKGVSAFAGFEAGVSYSAKETADILVRTFGKGGTADGAIEEFAQTTGGVLSMLGDAIFNFQGTIARSGLTDGFEVLTQTLADTLNESRKVAAVLGVVLGQAFKGLAVIIQTLKNNMDTVILSFGIFAGLGLANLFSRIAFRAIALVRSMASLAGLLGVLNIFGRGSIMTFLKLGGVIAIVGKAFPEFKENVINAMENLALDVAEALGDTPMFGGVKSMIETAILGLSDTAESLKGDIPFEFVGGMFDTKELEKINSLIGKNTNSTKSLREQIALLKRVGNDSELFAGAQDALASLEHQLRMETQPVFASLVEAATGLGDGITSLFQKMVEGTRVTLNDFKAMIRQTVAQVIAQIFRLTIVNAVLNSIFPGLGLPTATFSSLFRRDTGGAISARQPYLVGERGPELIVPNSASTVMNSNNTRSALSGGGGVTVVQNINVTTGVQQTVRTEIRSLMPEIAASAKNAVADTKRRGGNFGRAFA